MFTLTDTSKVVLVLSMLVEVVDDVGDREHCWFTKAPPGAQPPRGVALIEAVTKVLYI